jgi:hypothetical protein
MRIACSTRGRTRQDRGDKLTSPKFRLSLKRFGDGDARDCGAAATLA